MSETKQLGLTLVEAAQAQKHVTVNEALVRMDAAVALSVIDWDFNVPPVSPLEGDTYIVAAPATGGWTGLENSIAIYSNGGWIYLTPKAGWRAWSELLNTYAVFDGLSWQSDAISTHSSGAVTRQRIVEIDHSISAGATSTTIDLIPSHCQVIGVTARVIAEISGVGLSSWSLGVTGDETRFASGLGLLANSYANGLAGNIQAYWAPTPLILTPDAGTFTDGSVRIAAHILELEPPRAI